MLTSVKQEEGAVARARSVASILTEGADRIEANGGLTDDVVDALHEKQLFRLLLPRSIGGDELDLRTHAEVLEDETVQAVGVIVHA